MNEPKEKKPQQKEQKKAPPPSKTSAALKEREWADQAEPPAPEPYEETYRDGSLKNECW